MDILFQLFVLCVFLAVVLLLEGAYLAWNSVRGPEARKIQERLRVLSAGGHGNPALALLKQRTLSQMPALDAVLLRVPRIGTLDRLLIQSGLGWTVSGFLARCLGCAVAGFMLPRLAHLPPLFALCGALGAATLPLAMALRARRKRLDKFDEQLPEALDLIGRALRAGHAFPSALQMVADEAQPPIASEFRLTSDEVNYGIALKDALLNLATRMPSTDLRYFVIAVLIQRETGGNLAELLANIAMLIRARFKLLGTIRVLSAEGRLSAWILSLLPLGTALMINVVNPGFMDILWQNEMGLKLVKAVLVMVVLGILAMWRIVKIRV